MSSVILNNDIIHGKTNDKEWYKDCLVTRYEDFFKKRWPIFSSQ
jgi:hypothetical protein